MKNKLIKELKFCINIWKEKGGCTFGGKTKCENCATPYLLLKLISGEIIHGENTKRLSQEDWENKIRELEL